MPFYPHEIMQHQGDLGLLYYSTFPVPEATVDDFDPLERERLRQMVERYGGDRSLLALSDQELEGALGLVAQQNGRRVPTIAGLLLIGREAALRDKIPTHEVAFQVLQGTDVPVNEFSRSCILRNFERVMEMFSARTRPNACCSASCGKGI